MDLARGEHRAVWEYLRFFALVALGLSIVLIAAVALVSVLHVGPVSFERHHAVVHISIVVPFIAFGALLARVLQAGKYLASAAVSWRIAFPVLQIAMLAVLAILVERVTLDQAIGVAMLAVVLVCIWLWNRLRGLGLVELRRRPGLFDGRRALASSRRYVRHVAGLGLAQTDIFMVGLADEPPALRRRGRPARVAAPGSPSSASSPL